MTVELIRDSLAWCVVINIGVLLLWFLGFMVAHNWIYQLHGRWFKLSEEKFDTIQYASMGFFKLSILLFNIVPYLALRIVG
jgi:hypothetical protein